MLYNVSGCRTEEASMTTKRDQNHLQMEIPAPVTEDRLNQLNTTRNEQAVATNWLAWNQEQTRVVGRGKTRAEAEAAAEKAGETEPVLENVEKTRKRFADLYADGEGLVQRLLEEQGEPLAAADVGVLLGISLEEVEDRRSGGSLLALSVAGRSFLYPPWQFSKHALLPGFREVLEDLRAHNQHPLAHLRFFLSQNLRLGGETPLTKLRQGRMEEVRQAARAYGEHGAA
jgi:hypothetical protein